MVVCVVVEEEGIRSRCSRERKCLHRRDNKSADDCFTFHCWWWAFTIPFGCDCYFVIHEAVNLYPQAVYCVFTLMYIHIQPFSVSAFFTRLRWSTHCELSTKAVTRNNAIAFTYSMLSFPCQSFNSSTAEFSANNSASVVQWSARFVVVGTGNTYSTDRVRINAPIGRVTTLYC